MKKLFLTILVCAQGFGFDSVKCYFETGGDSGTAEAKPLNEVYDVKPVVFGKRFEFKVTYFVPRKGEPIVTTYVYGTAGAPAVLLHSQKFTAARLENTDERYGFTGQNFVYEPRSTSEFQYWCEGK